MAKGTVCSECGKNFIVKLALIQHIRSQHTGEKPYKCSICGKCFTMKGALQVHKKFHDNEYKYICAVCKKGFKVLSNLISHTSNIRGKNLLLVSHAKKIV